MPCIAFLFYKRLLKLLLNGLLLLTLSLRLSAQNVSTFEMTIPGTPGITSLERIPGTSGFYACSQNVYPDRIAPVIMKLDTAGNITRQKEYGLPAFKYIIQSRATAKGGLVLLGGYDAVGIDTVYCLSLTAGGAVAWCKSFYLPGQPLTGTDIIEDSNGEFVISGSIGRDNFLHDPFLLKLDKDGNSIWMNRFRNEADRDALGGGIIQKDDTIIFCSTIQPDDYPTPHNIRLSQVSLFDGSLLSIKDLLPEDIGFDHLKIYDDLHGGYYINASSLIYRSPCQTAFILRLDSNLQLLNNYSIANAGIAQGFGVLNDGTLNAGYQCSGYTSRPASSTLTKVSPGGQVVFSAHYPGVLSKPPFSPDTLVIISGAVSIGNQVFAGGRKKGKGFIAALNNFSLSQNNCSLIANDIQLAGEGFNIVKGEWTAMMNETVVATDLPVGVTNPGLTAELAICDVSPVLYVDQHATGLNDGSSWPNAYTSLAAAIDKMNFTTGIDTILVAAGTFTPAPNAAFIFSKLHSVILGGYPTGGGSRDAGVYVVILQGEVRFEKSARFDGFKVL